MRRIHREKLEEMRKILDDSLTEKELHQLETAMRFGYANAFCSRTCDMREEWYSAYNKIYDEVWDKLKKKEKRNGEN